MTLARKDPLLRVTRVALWITMLVAVITAAALILAVPGIWAFGDRILAELSERGVEASGTVSLLGISAVILTMLVLVGLAIQFLRLLIAVIDSVGLGSPFIPENTVRLRHMGWIVLIMQGIAIMAVPGAIWLRHAFPKEHIVFSFSFDGLIVALLLFVLARVCDHGTRLEADVEGTV